MVGSITGSAVSSSSITVDYTTSQAYDATYGGTTKQASFHLSWISDGTYPKRIDIPTQYENVITGIDWAGTPYDSSPITIANDGADTSGWFIRNWSYSVDGTTSIDIASSDQCSAKMQKRIDFQNRIRQQLVPNIIANRSGIGRELETAEERRARALLQEMISPKEYRNYLRTGFLTVHGRSGMIYRVSGLHKMMRCYVRGPDGKYKAVEDLCIIFKSDFNSLPYTDWVLMRKILIENDEFGMRKIAISHKIRYANDVAGIHTTGDINWVRAG